MVNVKACLPHRQRDGTLVCFLNLDSKPTGDVLKYLRRFGAWRNGPRRQGNGWHIPLENCSSLYKKIKDEWPDIAKCIKATVEVLETDPESVQGPISSPASSSYFRNFRNKKKESKLLKVEKLN